MTRTVPFDRSELAGRLARVRESAARDGLDLLVVTDPKNIFYLTGYDAYSFYVPQALLVPRSGDPVLVLRAMDVQGARVTTWLRDEALVGYPESCINDGPRGEHPFTVVAATVAERGFARARIGVERDGTLTPRELEILQAAFPASVFASCDGLVEWVRAVKSPAEIAVITEAAAISDAAMEVAGEAIRPGAREADVAAEVYAALVRGTGDLVGSTPAQPYMAMGENTNNPHLRWREGTYGEGPVYVELGGHRHNYAAGLSRSFHVGHPSPAFRRVEGVVTEGMAAAFEAMHVGARAEDVEAAWRKVIAPYGITKAARIGYSIGVSFPKTIWMEGTISLAPGDETVLVDGHVLHLMAAVWLDDVGYALSETVHVTDGGPRSLTRLPRELVVRT